MSRPLTKAQQAYRATLVADGYVLGALRAIAGKKTGTTKAIRRILGQYLIGEISGEQMFKRMFEMKHK